MKTAVVLSGGGAKGAYELGVWKALRKLGIDFDIVVGTSIGGLNGVMMAQGNYSKCLKTWYYMNYDYVSSMEIKGKYSTKTGRREIISKYTKGLFKGGYEMDGLSKIIDQAVDYDEFKRSKIDFGLATTHFPTFKGKYVTKKEMTKKNYKDYLLATAACFPAFKPVKAENELYVDGGYFDNIPYKLAVDMGADNLIIVDLAAIGITKNMNSIKVPHKIIKPKIKLGSILVFESNYTQMYAKLGYNDTLKAYGEADGDKYTFKKGTIGRNYKRNRLRIDKVLDKYKKNITSKTVKKLVDDTKNNNFINIIESMIDLFGFDPTKIYRASLINVMIKNTFLDGNYKKYDRLRKAIKFSRNNTSYELISFIYNGIIKDKKSINKYINIYPKAFLCAIYLYAIINRRPTMNSQ